MELNQEISVPPRRLGFWKILGVTFLILFSLSLAWYAKNNSAQKIVSGVVADPISVLANEGGVTNVLLLGMGGEGHAGGDLTDSILLASLSLKSGSAKMLAIPRDIWVPSMQAKINTAYHYGGTDLAKTAVAEILGVPVHYVFILDFAGFTRAIDAVGGIDVMVENTFDDFKYPIPGKENVEPESDRYQHLHFEKGLTHMDGSTALQFARSRYAVGEEGTDFARGKRQEKIILAFRHKVFSTQTLLNANTLDNLKQSVLSSVITDIDAKQQGAFLKFFLGMEGLSELSTVSLDEYLVNPKPSALYQGQWVLLPSPDSQTLKSYVQSQLAQ